MENELHKYRLDDNYIANIKTLSDLTIDINTEKYRIKNNLMLLIWKRLMKIFGLTVNKKYKDKTIKKKYKMEELIYMLQFNKQQQQAINFYKGSCSVIAGESWEKVLY